MESTLPPSLRRDKTFPFEISLPIWVQPPAFLSRLWLRAMRRPSFAPTEPMDVVVGATEAWRDDAARSLATNGLVAGAGVTDDQRTHATAMMERTGTVVEVADEDQLDRVTAVAGSGPGYVFELARAYVAAAEGLGFDRDQARALVLGTLEGTIAMAIEEDGQSLEDLRNSVTSKGGTTAAGLDALNGDGTMSRKFEATLEAAYKRAVELR